MYVTRIFVIPKRFERLTHALEGRCSIQLSYGTSLICLEPFPIPFAKIVRLFGCAKKKRPFLSCNFVVSISLGL